jgi:hypothetical protein
MVGRRVITPDCVQQELRERSIEVPKIVISLLRPTANCPGGGVQIGPRFPTDKTERLTPTNLVERFVSSLLLVTFRQRHGNDCRHFKLVGLLD